MNLYEPAQQDPAALHAVLAAPDVPKHVLRWGAEWLGARWTPDRWWPVLVQLSHSETAIDQEIALNAIEGRIVHECVEPNFSLRTWPGDIVLMRHEILTELERMAAGAHPVNRTEAAELAEELRTGRRWYDDESTTPPDLSAILPRC